MTIYRIEETDEGCVKSVTELKPGIRLKIEHGGLSVPVRVGRQGNVTIFLGKAKGNIGDLDVPIFGDDQFWNEGEKADVRPTIRRIVVCPEPGKSALNLFGTEEGLATFVSVRRFESRPVVGEKMRG